MSALDIDYRDRQEPTKDGERPGAGSSVISDATFSGNSGSDHLSNQANVRQSQRRLKVDRNTYITTTNTRE